MVPLALQVHAHLQLLSARVRVQRLRQRHSRMSVQACLSNKAELRDDPCPS